MGPGTVAPTAEARAVTEPGRCGASHASVGGVLRALRVLILRFVTFEGCDAYDIAGECFAPDIAGTSVCCARAASGEAAAAAPPSSVMNVRLFTRSPRRRGRAASVEPQGRSSWPFAGW